MDFVSPIITPIVQSLMVPVKKHMSFLFSSTTYVRNMRARLLELNHTAHGLEQKKDANDANNLLVPDYVPSWLSQVIIINEEAGDIPRGGDGCLNIKKRYTAGKRSFDILNKINDLERQESRMKWTNEQIPLGMVISSTRPSTSTPVYHDDDTQNIFKSRVLIFNDVLKSLGSDSNTQKMALCGMGGVGKTTMMEELKRIVERRGMFKWVFKVVIGEKYDPIAIQQAIAQYMGGEALTETTRDARADRLRKRFEKMSENGTKKIFIILDDVWEKVDLKDIGLTSPLPKGFKLLVTSRNEKVCINMDIEASSIFRLVGLEEIEANYLFWETVRLTDGDDELHKIGDDILRKCGGLPMAIKTIALTLRGEHKDAWKGALVRLQRRDLEDLYSIVASIFEISYNNLKKEDDKEIFILCGLFPDDYEIVMEELMRYGWGLKLFNKAYSLIEARQRTNTSVSNLIRANLLTESNNKGCVKMHDLARDFILTNISKFKQASIVNYSDKSEWPTQDTQESCERILLKCTGMSEFSQDFSYPNLALLKLMNGDKPLKFPEFHKRMKKLEVVAFDKMKSPLHLVSLQSINLRTLCLHSCLLVDNDISFLGDLINLEVLSITHCGIRKLPHTIGKLKRLKLLDLTGCVDLCIDDGVFQNLDKLEELYMRVSKGKPIKFTDANCEEMKMLSSKLYALEIEFFENILDPKNVSFKKLQRFRISMGCLLNEKTIHIGYLLDEENVNTNATYSFKNTLKFVTNCNELLECKINELFSETEELHLCVEDMSYVEDISMHTSQYSTFCNLKVLHIFNCGNLTHLFTNPLANGFKKLESLTISSCHVLTSLVSLRDDVNVMELPQLLDLKLYDLPNFTSIFPDNNISQTKSFLNNKVLIPKLSKLTVHSMENLKQMWPCDIISGEDDNVSMLREIEVKDCNSLVNLFPKNPIRILCHVEELSVQRCSVDVLFDINLGQIEGHWSSNLRRIKVLKLQELKEVWRIENENNSCVPIVGFQAMESIHIESCKKFRNVFTPITARFDMRSLVDINIIDCGENSKRNDAELFNNKQEHEVQISVLSKPEILEVDENKSIIAFPSYHLIQTFHHLRHIKIDGYEGVKVVFEIESPSNNRKLMTTPQQPLCLLPCLEDLELENLDVLSHVWKWKEVFIHNPQQRQSSLFNNLATIRLYKCNGIKYLFSPLMSKLLSNLKTIKIISCEGMEELVSNRDDDDDDGEVLTTFTSTTTLFPHLDSLVLCRLYNLKRIGGDAVRGTTNVTTDQFKLSQASFVSWFLCQCSKEINIEECHALSSVIPCYAAGKMQKLQVLMIDNCRSMVEVFETILPIVPRPRQITMHELPNLKILKIYKCDLLEYVFTLSMLQSLRKLENLSIVECATMKVIVREEKEETSSKVVVSFPCLKSIELNDLPKLAGFILGMNIDIKLPSIDYVMINDCPQMNVFTSGQSTAPKLEYIHTQLGKHNLECGLNFHLIPSSNSNSSTSCPTERTPWSFHNIIEIYLESNAKLNKIIPSNELVKLQNLEKITVIDCKYVEEVFEEVANNELLIVVRFPKLREMEFNWLDNLMYIWKSNQQRILEFPNLTRVFINLCNSLEHVFTSSMVCSLVQLQELRIVRCNNMEVIVKKEEEEDCDGKVSEVVLPSLKLLELEYIWSLKGFCLGAENFSFPSLNTLVIKECPNMRIFSEGRAIAPMLKLVETSFGLFQGREDINSFIVTKTQEGIRFGELEEPPPCLVM